MNKKGKNKKAKIPNPVPPDEPSDKTDDIPVMGDLEKASVENMEVKPESVKEERVPEIVSEVVKAPVDTKDEETPKKPKRNRGKKKKGKEDDFDDNLEDNPKEDTPVEETKLEIVEVEKEDLDTAAVTPTARKKKNKKKNAEQKIEEPNMAESEKVVPPATEGIKKPAVPEAKQEPITLPETAEQETKPSKKKNKKKKRNDSERSEKEELSCTSAFQKLIEVKDEPVEMKMEEKVEGASSLEEVKPDIKSPPKDPVIQEMITEKDSAISPAAEEKDPQQTSEGKSKKKNKKDKKHIPKSEESIPKIDEPVTEPSLKPVEVLTENVPKDDVHKDTILIDKPELLKEASPKPKAKIAKPVEKKRKGKQENKEIESFQQELAESPKPDEPVVPAVTDTPERKMAEKDAITEVKDISQAVPTETVIELSTAEHIENLTIKDFESLNLADKAMGKKRKKGSKMPRTPDVSFEILDTKLETETKQSDIQSENKEMPSLSEAVSEKEPQVSTLREPSPMPIIVDTKEPITKPTVIKDHVLLTPEVKDHIQLAPEDKTPVQATTTDTLVVEKAEDTQKHETKSNKKRKKSPKPPKKDTKVDTETQASNTKDMAEKIDASNITKMYDIEISSIKAEESEGSVCDTVPDITYPRASSQQLLDDNNNTTVIREIFPVQEITDSTKVIEKEHNVSPSKEEKTDIKSKMMEVNQDMEELRMSIERSLAELTAIEKSEEDVQKQFEKAETKTKEKDDATQKKEEHEKMIQISDAEKSSIEKREETAENVHITLVGMKPVDTQAEPSKIAERKIESKAPDVVLTEIKEMKPETEIKKDTFKKLKKEKSPKPPKPSNTMKEKINQPVIEEKNTEQKPVIPIPPKMPEYTLEPIEIKKTETDTKPKEEEAQNEPPPVCPARKDNKNKHKKKKGKQDAEVASQPTQSTTSSSQTTTQETKKDDPKDAKETKTTKKDDSKDTKEKGKQQASATDVVTEKDAFSDMDYEPIENFEDALTSSLDDVHKTFEMIVEQSQDNPKINIIAPDDEKTKVTPPKNLLGHPDIPVPSSKRDYKKEKDKIPNEIAATVKIKDAVDVERKQSKDTQTVNKLKDWKNLKMSDNEEFVYKYSFRKVFLQSSCNVCKKDLDGSRVPCCYCNLVFYCGIKHKDEDWPQHQALCFAVSTIGHLKDQKHIYADTKNITGHDYRLVRMQMIVSCEKILKRRLVPWEQEALLYPRMCAHIPCREWRQMKLSDCPGCGQISYCTDNPDHCPKPHARWCKSYSLYQKLVSYQQTKGRLEPRLPTKVMKEPYTIPDKMNEVLAEMYEEKIEMNDIQYAALTQLATAPLTAAYCHQLCRNKNITANGYKKTSFTIHVVGAELQFEADALNKWEVFFLHLRPDLQELKVVLINYDLNPSNLPLELLGKIKLCEDCLRKKRRVVFSFQDKKTYADYKSSEDFVVPDLVCAFNPNIQRSSVYNGKDHWPSTINVILKQKIPFIITGYTITELHRDCIRIKECSEIRFNFISDPKYNTFASVRPDRNFISDDEMPLLFKNYCFAIVCA